jgi:hypothetical protein
MFLWKLYKLLLGKYIIENNIKQIKNEKNVFFFENLINEPLSYGY